MKLSARSIIITVAAVLGISGLVLVVLASILSNSLLQLIGGAIVVGVVMVILFVKFSDTQVKINKEKHDFIIEMARFGYLPSNDQFKPARVMLIEPPKDEPQPTPAIDPRHALLVSLCRITIRSKAYGPTSPKLMTADDAQADVSGLFKDRSKSWEEASKYGQSIGFLYTQKGGPPAEQGLKIHGTLDNGDPVDSAADLLVALHEPSLPRRAAIAALPPTQR